MYGFLFERKYRFPDYLLYICVQIALVEIYEPRRYEDGARMYIHQLSSHESVGVKRIIYTRGKFYPTNL